MKSPGDTRPAPQFGSHSWLLGAMTAIYVARPLIPSEAVAQRGDGVIFVMLWLLLAGVWVVACLKEGRESIRFGPTDAAVVMLIGLHSLSAFVAAGQGSPRPAINMLWEWIAMGVGFLLVRQLVASRAEARALLVTMIGLGVALSAIGFYQYFYGMEQDRAIYERIKDDSDETARVVGEWLPPDSPQRMQFENRLYGSEPTATFALTNSLAGYLAPWLIVLFALEFARQPGEGPPCDLRRISTVIMALSMAGCLLLTKSRSGILAVIVGGVLSWQMCRPGRMPRSLKRIVIVAGFVMALIIAAIVVGGLDRKVWTEAGRSVGYRFQYWQATLAMIHDHPWLGCGPGQFQNEYTAYKLPEASEEIRDPHNFLFEVWATAGTPALLALLGALVCFSWAALKTDHARVTGATRRGPANEEPDSSNFVGTGAIVGWLLAWLVAPLVGMPMSTATLVIGLTATSLSLFVLRRPTDHVPSMSRLAFVGVVVLLVNLLATGGIGYPGVSGTWWLLMAVALIDVDSYRVTVHLHRHAGWTALALLTALAVACYVSDYRPVVRSRLAMDKAFSGQPYRAGAHRAGDQRERSFVEATQADPWSSEAARQLAAQRFYQWQTDPTQQTVKELRTATVQVTQLAPRSSSAWAQVGAWWLEVYRKTGDDQFLTLAFEGIERSVTLYPNSAQLHAQYAIVLETMGRQPLANRHATRSLQLETISREAGHQDKLLGDELRTLIKRIRG